MERFYPLEKHGFSSFYTVFGVLQYLNSEELEGTWNKKKRGEPTPFALSTFALRFAIHKAVTVTMCTTVHIEGRETSFAGLSKVWSSHPIAAEVACYSHSLLW